MKRISVSTGIATLLLSFLASNAYAAPGVTDPAVLKDLAALRQATVKYHDVNEALADGFIRTPRCVEVPGLGGMGIHFINPARLRNPAVKLLEPEILLYAETEDGMKLLAVEYFFGIGPPDAPVPDPAPPAPVLFARPFNGPMLGHRPRDAAALRSACLALEGKPGRDVHAVQSQGELSGTGSPLTSPRRGGGTQAAGGMTLCSPCVRRSQGFA